MSEQQVARTLVKSLPELWEVCSDPESLARHLQPFGEIKITRLEPESTVAWEGERASGTVRIEASGWGTKVTLTASAIEAPVVVQTPEQVVVEPEPAPVAVAPEYGPAKMEPAPLRPPAPVALKRRGGFFSRLARAWFSNAVAPVQVQDEEPTADPAPLSVPPPVAAAPEPVVASEPIAPPPPQDSVVDALAVLDAALNSLGQDHHRPFSRS